VLFRPHPLPPQKAPLHHTVIYRPALPDDLRFSIEFSTQKIASGKQIDSLRYTCSHSRNQFFTPESVLHFKKIQSITWFMIWVFIRPTTKCSRTIFFLVICIIRSSIVPRVTKRNIMTCVTGRKKRTSKSLSTKCVFLSPKHQWAQKNASPL
jgi:hypothetical protein